MKIGISIKLDVTKIDKTRLFKGAKGTYLDLTTFIDTDNPSQYGDHGFVSQSVTKEERAQNLKTPILGNVKVFYGLNNSGQQGGYQPPIPPQQQHQPPKQQYQPQNHGYQPPQQQPAQEDDIPF